MSDKRIRVLLIEDNPLDARLIREFLADTQGGPYDLEVCERLKSGRERLGQGNLDVVLVDLALPDSQGLATFEKVRDATPSLPILVLTGNDDDTVALAAVQSGAQDYLVKGQFDEHLLGRVIRYAIERKRLQIQFLQAQKMEAIGQLAGGVAHDFNNLLMIINGQSQIMLGRMKPDDPARREFEMILAAGNRAAGLTRQLLAFSRQQVLAPKVLDLNRLVSGLHNMLCRLVREDIVIKSVEGKGLGPVLADPGQIEQVLVNLVVNARDAMPNGGHITIETQNVELDDAYTQTHAEVRRGPHVLLAVSDTGCGMNEQVKARIFEPFFTTKEVGRGTGLGLCTIHGIVKQSGGSIEVYSEVGVGTAFKIYFPQAEGKAALSHVRLTPVRKPTGSEVILLVENEEAVRELLREILERSGYFVIPTGHGVEALEVAGAYQGSIDLLVSDVIMPNMGGPELVKHLVQTRPAIKVLLISGYTDNAVLHGGLVESDVQFLQKPFSPSELEQKVRMILDAPELANPAPSA